MTEAALMRSILLAVGGRSDCRLFRNNCGVALHPDGSRVVYGLCPGSSDLIGWQSIEIAPEMVGQRITRFLALEIKTNRGRLTDRQRAFLEVVASAGGIGAVVRSENEALELLR